MRRLLYTAVASIAVVAFVPATALGRTHHRRHHHHHRRHHHRVRIHRFGHLASSRGGSDVPTTPSSAVGTITFWDPTTGKLVITLSDGTTTETGFVTSDTDIQCQSSGDMQDDLSADGAPGSSGGDDQGEDDNGDNGNNDDQGEDQSCSTTNITTGTMVSGAELSIDGNGPVWDELDLMA
jgi:hypothetical protein